MAREVLPEDRLHPGIRAQVAALHAGTVAEVQSALQRHAVVVVGMAGNPFVRKARKALDGAGIPFEYLEYGSYLAEWRRRNALKMWTGWPTFPMVFVRGTLIGGAAELGRLLASGELKDLRAA